MPKGKGGVMKLYYSGKWHDSDGSLGGRDVSVLSSGWLAAKPAPKAKWAPYAPALSIKETKRSLYLKLEEMVATINNLGAENARLKNQITKLKGAKA